MLIHNFSIILSIAFDILFLCLFFGIFLNDEGLYLPFMEHLFFLLFEDFFFCLSPFMNSFFFAQLTFEKIKVFEIFSIINNVY